MKIWVIVHARASVEENVGLTNVVIDLGSGAAFTKKKEAEKLLNVLIQDAKAQGNDMKYHLQELQLDRIKVKDNYNE